MTAQLYYCGVARDAADARRVETAR